MKDKPLVSVIMPFLNAEKFIGEAIDSVFAQTYTSWEILLVDDGLSDGSARIALDYNEKNPERARYLEHDRHMNKGTIASRNLGIQNAKGKYIAFLDANDVWVENKLEEQVEVLETHTEASMVYGNTKYWYSWTQDPEDLKRDYIVNYNMELNRVVNPPELLIYALESKTITPTPSNIMVRRDTVLNIGGFVNVFIGMHDDHAFLAKLFINTSVYVADRCWDFYRQHPDSLSTVAIIKGEKAAAELFYLIWLEKYLTAQGIKNIDLWNALRHRKWRYGHPIFFKLLKYGKLISRTVRKILKNTAQYILPKPVLWYLSEKLRIHEHIPSIGKVKFGDLRRLNPVSNHWGSDRGLPVDRYYIEKFLASNTKYIMGNVLEVGDDSYTRKFGREKIIQSNILNLLEESNPNTTIIADITSAPHIPSDNFDCIIFTQTLQLIYDFRSAIQTLYRILKPGGVLLATFPGISQTAGTT